MFPFAILALWRQSRYCRPSDGPGFERTHGGKKGVGSDGQSGVLSVLHSLDRCRYPACLRPCFFRSSQGQGAGAICGGLTVDHGAGVAWRHIRTLCRSAIFPRLGPRADFFEYGCPLLPLGCSPSSTRDGIFWQVRGNCLSSRGAFAPRRPRAQAGLPHLGVLSSSVRGFPSSVWEVAESCEGGLPGARGRQLPAR